MSDDRKILNDVARLASGAAGTLFGMRDEMEARFRAQMERVLTTMDMVRRDEFEAVRIMAEQARAENELLKNRIEALEVRLSENN